MSEVNLNANIQYLKGVGPKIAKKLNKLGIETISDLVYHFPRTYKDYTQISKISDLINNDQFSISNQFNNESINQNKTIRVKVVGVENKRTSRRGFTVTEAVVTDDTGSLQVVWFNQPFLKKILKPGTELLLNGEVKYNNYSNSYVMESPDRAKKPSIVPIYPETKGVSSFYIAKLIFKIKNKILKINEHLPEEILNKYNLMDYSKAIWQLHQPENSQKLAKAKERLAFDELFFAALRARINKEELKKRVAPLLKTSEKEMKEFVKSLPFKLTNDQKRSMWQIAQDIGGRNQKPSASIHPMNRLLNGDVGSGKTVVAVFAVYIAHKAGYKSVVMAPTQILANQHFETLKQILKPFEVKIALVTATTKKQEDIEKANLIVGTQAILHMKKKAEKVGLVIVDEQHRFGVKQRAKIKEIAKDGDKSPHFLSMTATPIPRTLYLSLFSDLDISIISEMPKGRKKVRTKFVDEENRNKAYNFIRKQIKAGRQAFVICPLIEDKDESGKAKESLFDIDKKSVIAEYEKLDNEIFPDLKIGILHGKMKAKEKDKVMADFASAKLNILVSTSVVEVGVDVPNASIMMIEDAERFGLAQLHQFRGRVGRGGYQSYCFVFSNSKSKEAISRLRSFENISDGFKLAEIDLENRGAGQIYGKIQSGHFDFIFADLGDTILLNKTSKAAGYIIEKGINNLPLLKGKFEEYNEIWHLE